MTIVIGIQKIYLMSIKIFHFQLRNKKIEERNKLVCNIHGEENWVVDIKALDKALNDGLILKKMYIGNSF